MKDVFWDYYWYFYRFWWFREPIRFYKYVLKIDIYLQICIIITFVALVIYSIYKKLKLVKSISLSVIIPYIMLLFSSLVLSRNSNTDYLYSFELFWSIRDMIANRPELLKEILLNLFMLVPFGLLCPILLRKKWKTIPIGIAISVSIELLQLITKTGMCELDDVIYNTTGLLIGYGVYYFILLIRKSIKNKKQEKTNGI